MLSIKITSLYKRFVSTTEKHNLFKVVMYVFILFALVTLDNLYVPKINLLFSKGAQTSHPIFEQLFYLIFFVIILPSKLLKWKWKEISFKW